MADAHADDRLARAAREILSMASAPVEIGDHHDREAYVVVPQIALTWLQTALGPAATPPTPRIEVSPQMKGGTPVINGHRLGAVDMAERYWYLGEHVQSEILDAFELTRAELLTCCWYAAEYGPRRLQKAWKAWLAETWARTGLDKDTDVTHGWWGDLSDIPYPPTKRQHAAATDQTP